METDTTPKPEAAPDSPDVADCPAPICYDAVRSEAEADAATWEPITQNHCPSYWRALRDAYASGYMAGVLSRHNTKS
jgi:hypothetical protein